MAEDLLSFKDMCRRFDVTPRTLRYYEYIELLSPVREGRARYYTPRDVGRMFHIMRARRWGFSLEEVRQWLLIYDTEGTHAQARAFVELADKQLGVLKAQRAEIDAAISELSEVREATDRDYPAE